MAENAILIAVLIVLFAVAAHIAYAEVIYREVVSADRTRGRQAMGKSVR